MRTTLKTALGACAIYALLTASVWAQTTTDGAAIIGYVKTATAAATVTTGPNSVPAAPGTPVYRTSVVTTGDNASVGITLKDSTLMSIGPRTSLSLDDFAFDPGGGQLRLAATVAKGTLQYVSGTIAKLKPENVAVKTPGGIIGVRGTHFVVKVEDGQ